jgi:hypothetical protein
VQPGGDMQVHPRGLQVSARVIVEQHLAATGHAGKRQYLADGAARHRARRRDDAVPADFRDE